MKFIHILLFPVLLLSACEPSVTQDNRDSELVDRQQSHYAKHQPIPFYQYSQPRAALTEIYNQTTAGVRSYSVFTALGDGEPRFMCPSFGSPMPADTQLTNPTQIIWASTFRGGHYESGVVGQAEPDGTFSSTNTDGTWVLCIRSNGDVAAVYTELKVTAFPFQVRWNPATRMIEEIGGDATTMKVVVRGIVVEKNTQIEAAPGAGQ